MEQAVDISFKKYEKFDCKKIINKSFLAIEKVISK
jgi:hypothetical protein